MKICPYCAEEIQSEARKCKHCGEWLQGASSDLRGLAAQQPSVPSLPPAASMPASERAAEAQSDTAAALPDQPSSQPAATSLSTYFNAWLVATFGMLSITGQGLMRAEAPGFLKWLAVLLIAFNAAFAVMLVSVLIGAWLLFSTDRRGQLRLVFSSFRGY